MAIASATENSQLSAVWWGKPAIRSIFIFSMPAARRCAMSSSTVARLCWRPTDAASRSTNDCTPRLTRFTPQRWKASSTAGVSVPGAHSTVISASRVDRKSLRNRDKQSFQLRYIEYGRCATAEEDGIHGGFVHAAHLSGEFTGVIDVRNHAFHVALEHGAGEDVRGEVAVAAFGAAEWHRDVEAQGHVTNYPTSRNVVSAERITCHPERSGCFHL